jgi:hypothetical protein
LKQSFRGVRPRDRSFTQEDVQLLSFRRDVAYARQFPSLTPVKLAEGVLDLQDNIPRADKTLLAPAARLVCSSRVASLSAVSRGPGWLGTGARPRPPRVARRP